MINNNNIRSKIVSTGAYIPTEVRTNHDFLSQKFYDDKHTLIQHETDVIIKKFKAITGIEERRYAAVGVTASDMATAAAEEALTAGSVDRESIDQIIVAHNYGDMEDVGGIRDMVPSLASRVKHKLGIRNSACVPYDIVFGCPGWLQGLIQADQSIRAGSASTSLVIGAETLSRVIDPTDRDSMIFSDGAGACIIQKNTENDSGLMNGLTRSHTGMEIDYIFSKSRNDDSDTTNQYIKMQGRKVYEYALKHVPMAMKECLDQSGEKIENLKMVLLHQANQKMDEAIISRFFELYGSTTLPDHIMPMNISFMGNSSVATIPTLLNQVLKTGLSSYKLQKGDIIMMASVGAGMNINAITYKW